MRTSELIRRLSRLGCEVEKGKRKGKGSHFMVVFGQRTAIVSDHPGEVPTGTLNNILKSLGLQAEFRAGSRRGRTRLRDR